MDLSQEGTDRGLDVIETCPGAEQTGEWLQLSEKADAVLDIWQRLADRKLAVTFWIWYLRLIRERSALGLECDEAWKQMRR